MREFAHPDRAELVPADLNRCVETTLAVSRNEYRDVADVVTELDPDLPSVPCLPGEINQVLLNLFVNAAHAIGERPDQARGTIRVRSGMVDEEAQIRVQDDGPGIPVEVQDKIFDPFFTTKEVGRGIGQGLSTSRAIVARHHGRLTFSSMPGWTEFVMALPLIPPV
jgi:signal transduction histidine kinase